MQDTHLTMLRLTTALHDNTKARLSSNEGNNRVQGLHIWVADEGTENRCCPGPWVVEDVQQYCRYIAEVAALRCRAHESRISDFVTHRNYVHAC